MLLADLLHAQSGVVTRRQLLELGVGKPALDRLVRRRELTRLHPGVYVDHTGAPSWRQRCWAACLYADRAVLHLDSALAEPRQRRVVHVAVDAARRVLPQPGIQVHRVRALDRYAAWHTSPPRIRLEHTVLALADLAPTDVDAIGEITGAVGSRRTTAARLAEAMAERPRLRRRRLLEQLLVDVDRGTHSVLEHGYLTRVLRPHSLPAPTRRQAALVGRRGREYRDVEHADLGLFVELDGAVHDDPRAADDDAWRDLADLAAGHVTPRLRYPQVYGDQCRTAAILAALFTARGWTGRLRPCGRDCSAA